MVRAFVLMNSKRKGKGKRKKMGSLISMSLITMGVYFFK